MGSSSPSKMERRCCISRTTYVNQAAAPAIPAAGRVTLYALGDNLYQIDDAGVVTLLSGIPAHAATHENGGGDEISVLGLSGLLADGQTPLAHAASHQNGGADEISVLGLSGLLADNQNAIPAAGIDTTAIHDNVAAEINAIAVKAAPANADIVVIEDSAAGWAKKKAAVNTLPARNLQAVCDVGNVTTTAMGVAGGTIGDANADADDLVLGVLASAAAPGMTLLCTTTGKASYSMTDVAGQLRGGIIYTFTNDRMQVRLSNNVRFTYTVTDIRPNFTMSLGVQGAEWKRLFSDHRAMGVLQIGDASAALDDEEFVRIAEPAAGINTATLPAAVLGYTYIIEVTAGAGGTVDIATVGGDTINGAGSPLAGIGPGWHQLIAQDANDWRYAKLA